MAPTTAASRPRAEGAAAGWDSRGSSMIERFRADFYSLSKSRGNLKPVARTAFM